MKPVLLNLLFFICLQGYSQTLRQQLLSKDSTLEDVRIIKCKTPGLFIAILVRYVQLSERISILKFQHGKINWEATFNDEPDGRAFDSARQIFITEINNPVFEIFDESLSGFGYYYLYELRGKKLCLIAMTLASDGNGGDDMTINNKHYDLHYELKPRYKDVNKDGLTDIELTGYMDISEIYSGNTRKNVRAKKVLIYNKKSGKFIEDRHYRTGFSKLDN